MYEDCHFVCVPAEGVAHVHAREKVQRSNYLPASAAEALSTAAIAAQAIVQPDDDPDMILARRLAACGEAAYTAKVRSRRSRPEDHPIPSANS